MSSSRARRGVVFEDGGDGELDVVERVRAAAKVEALDHRPPSGRSWAVERGLR